MNTKRTTPIVLDGGASLGVAIIASALLLGFDRSVPAQSIHRFTGISVLSNGTAQLTLTGSVASTFFNYFDLYPIEATTDLVNWTPLATLVRTNSSSAPLRYIDPEAVLLSRRFYRTPTNQLVTGITKPTGPYPVATVSRQLVDPTRTNRMPFWIQMWYPATPQAGLLPGAYLDRRIAGEMAAVTGQPLFQNGYSHSQPGAGLATNEARYPIVLYSHGQPGPRTDNVSNAENLASHGFVVVSVEHFYTYLTVLEDSRLLYGVRPEPNNVNLADRIRDVQFVMDELARMNGADSIFGGRLDLDRLGMFGWSFGGGVTVEVCASDPRCKAGVSLDGGIYTYLLGLGFNKPFMIISGDDNYAFIYPHRNAFRALFDKFSHPDAYWLRISGASHFAFADYSWLITPPNATRLRHALVIRDYLAAFFRKHLRSDDNHLLDRPSAAYPEANPFLRSALTIITQPQSQSIARGSNVTFTVSVTSPLPITYQWRVNTTNLLSATNVSLTLTNVQPDEAGSYSVALADGVSVLTSQEAILSVSD